MSYNEQLRCNNLTTNHEGAAAWRMTPEWELYSSVVTTMGVEDTFYERGDDRARRIADLVRKVEPEYVAQLAIYAREAMHLRSVPLLLLVELAQCHRGDSLVSRAVSRTLQRADEITELLMCYQWRTGKRDLTGLSSQLRKGLADAFNHFDEYQFAKYNRKDRKVTLRDALRLVHPKPKDERQKELFRKILSDSLETPYTWETELSRVGRQRFDSAADKKEAVRKVWQELIASRRMGYMATLRNLRNMLDVQMDKESIEQVCNYLANAEAVAKSRQLPFRFLSAFNEVNRTRSSCRRPLQNEIMETAWKIRQVEWALESRRAGTFRVRVRKVVRYGLMKTIGQRARLHGSMKFVKPTMHSRCRRSKNVHAEHPNMRMRKELRQLEKVLAGLQRREGLLRRKQALLEERYGHRWMRREQLIDSVLQALETAACHSAANITGFDEGTRVLLASDVSGSMELPVSRNSSMMCYYIGLLLSMLMKSKCPQAVTGMFGDIWKVYDMPSANVLQNTLDMISREGEVGYSTNGHKVINWLIKEKRVMDKVMLFTDMELWDGYGYGGSLAKSWDKYKRLAPDARLYIFDLVGYGLSPVRMERDDVFCIAGWSDRVFDILAAIERGNSAIDEIRRIVV